MIYINVDSKTEEKHYDALFNHVSIRFRFLKHISLFDKKIFEIKLHGNIKNTLISKLISNRVSKNDIEKHEKGITPFNICDDLRCFFINMNVENFVKQLLIGRPAELLSLKEDHKHLWENSEFKSVMKAIFDYDSFRNGDINRDWDNTAFIKALGIKTCPYCNRSYIFNVERNKDQRTRITAQLDHFFSQSYNPMFALSLYNLVPSCSVCNIMKSDSSEELVSPYNKEIENSYVFKYKIKEVEYFSNPIQKEEKIDVEIEATEHKFKNNISEFGLDSLYNKHKDVVAEILTKKQHYPKSNLASIQKKFGISESEAYRIIYANYQDKDEHHKRPLSRLTKDVFDHFDDKRLSGK